MEEEEEYPWVPWPFADLHPDLVLVEAILVTKLGHSHAHPVLTEAATNCGSFCISKQVAEGQSQAMPGIYLDQSPLLDRPIKHQGTIQLVPKVADTKSRQAPDPDVANFASWCQPLHNISYTMVIVNTHCQPAGRSTLPTKDCQQ